MTTELPLESARNFVVFALFVGIVIGIALGAVAQSLLARLYRSEPTVEKTQGEKPGYGNSSNDSAA